MTKGNYLMILFLAVLAVVYAVYFTDWFRPKTLKVFHVERHLRGAGAPARPGVLTWLTFGIGRQMPLTEVRVVADDDFKTNKSPVSLWHLVTDSNSIPTETFFYGQNIRGMRPDIKGSRPQDLTTNVMYRLIVTAGKYKGENEFKLE